MSKQPAISVADYVLREAAAERLLDRKVETWRAEPGYKAPVKAASTFAGLLGTAAAVGFLTGGPIAAIALPVIPTLPAVFFSAGASGLSDTEQDVREYHRHEAYRATGLEGVRDPRKGPTLIDRLARLLGRTTATAAVDRAQDDIDRRVWGPKPSTVTYAVTRERIEPVLDAVREQRILAHGPATKIRMAEDGSALVTHTLGPQQGQRGILLRQFFYFGRSLLTEPSKQVGLDVLRQFKDGTAAVGRPTALIAVKPQPGILQFFFEIVAV